MECIPRASSKSNNYERDGANGKKKELRERLSRVPKYCGLILLGAFMQFATVAQGFGQEFSESKEKSKGEIHYRTPEAERKLKEYERFYPSFKELKVPLVVGSMEEEIKNLSETDQVFYQSRFGHVGAFAFRGSMIPENLLKQLGMGRDTVYILYGTGEISPENKIRIPYHEGIHARHYAEQLNKNPDDTVGYIRYPELSTSVNLCIEELITGAKTIDWLESRENDGGRSMLTEEEMKHFSQAVKKEKSYFLDNYYAYYFERYGSEAEIPAGEGIVSDPVDGEIEKMFRDSHILETLKERAQKFRDGEE